MTRLVPLLGSVAVLFLAACTSNGEPSPTATPTTEATAAPTLTPTPGTQPGRPPPTTEATPPPAAALTTLAATVWLIDLESEVVTTIVEDDDDRPFAAEFSESGDILVRYWIDRAPVDRIYAPSGALLDETEPEPRCTEADIGAQIDGQILLGASCGSFSPDGRLMTYRVVTDEQLSWDQWLVDLENGVQRLLHADLHDCGGCDFRFGPGWSPSSRYLVLPDLTSQVFLIDTLTGASTDIALDDRATQLSSAPQWSPLRDQLVRPGPDGTTILQNLEAGTALELTDVPWPAAFDPTGTYVYSPAWAVSSDVGPHQRTTVAEVATGEVVGGRVGTPSSERIWGVGGDPIVAAGGNFVAALENSEDCPGGTLIFDPGLPAATCVEDARAAVLSPDASLVALARETGRTGPVSGPGFSTSEGLLTFEIIVFDRSTKEVTVVAEGVADHVFPAIIWNEAGTRLLIRWPNPFGI